VQHLRSPFGGLFISDKKHNLKTYPNVFIGSQCVDWFIEYGYVFSREEGIELGQQLIEKNVIHHVADDHKFKDEYLFYRFLEDEEKVIIGPSVASLISNCTATQHGYMLKKGQLLWNTRYVVLKADQSIVYYFDKDLSPNPRNAIDISQNAVVKEEVGLKKNSYCFSITTPLETAYFACNSSKEQEKWIQSLIDAGVTYKAQDIQLQYNSIYEMPAKLISGEEISLSQFSGQVLIVVNVASE